MAVLVLFTNSPAQASLIFSVHAIDASGNILDTGGVFNVTGTGTYTLGLVATIDGVGTNILYQGEGSLVTGVSGAAVTASLSVLADNSVHINNTSYANDGNSNIGNLFSAFATNGSADGTVQQLNALGGTDIGSTTNLDGNSSAGNSNFIFRAGNSGVNAGVTNKSFLIGAFTYTVTAINTLSTVDDLVSFNVASPFGVNNNPLWKDGGTLVNQSSGTIVSNSLAIHLQNAGNDSQILLPDNQNLSTGSSTATMDLGGVLVGFTGSGSVNLTKTGTNATTYGSQNANGLTFANGSFAAGSDSTSLLVSSLAAASATSGDKSLSIDVHNLAPDSAGAGLGSADANDTISAALHVFQSASVSSPQASTTVLAGSPITLTNAASTDGGQRGLAELGNTIGGSFVTSANAKVLGDFTLQFNGGNPQIPSATNVAQSIVGTPALKTNLLAGTHYSPASIEYRDNQTLVGASPNSLATISFNLKGDVAGPVNTGTAIIPIGSPFGDVTSPAGTGLNAITDKTDTQAPNMTTFHVLLGTNQADAIYSSAFDLKLSADYWREKGIKANGQPGSLAGGESALISDIVKLTFTKADGSALLTGINNSGVATAITPSYLMQMKYDPTLFGDGSQEAQLEASGNIALVYNAGTDSNPAWDMANAGNVGGGNVNAGDISWANYATAHGITSSNISDFLGTWGFDSANNVAWAVVNHGGEFAVVPEPSSLVLLGMGLALLGFARTRRNRKI